MNALDRNSDVSSGELQSVNLSHTLTGEEEIEALNEAVADAIEDLGYEVEWRHGSDSGPDEKLAREWRSETILVAGDSE